MRKSIFLLIYLWSVAVHGQTLALTFDDGLDPATEPSAHDWNRQLLAGLTQASIRAMIFPALSRIGGEEGRELLMQWCTAGHLVGNHTSRHRNLASAKVSLAEFIQDVEEADTALNKMPTWVPMLRFPYLKEGDTAEKRDGVRQWMRTHGYRPAPVSIDTSDWYFNQIWLALVATGQSAKLVLLQRAYIDHLLGRARYYDALAKETLHRSPPHVMLLHVNAINAASIGLLANEFKVNGWTFISAAEAFADPLYIATPSTLPAGESIVWAHAKAGGASGLRYPAEDSVYEEPRLRAKNLLP